MCPYLCTPSFACQDAAGTYSPLSSPAECSHPPAHHPHPIRHHHSSRSLLQAMARHLDLLTAGSLFLLPSILPYLASALAALSPSPLARSAPTSILYASPPPTAADPPGLLDDWSWETTWVMLLPCVGLMVPLVLFKIMTTMEESTLGTSTTTTSSSSSSTSRCPFKNWTHSLQFHRSYAARFISTCPTMITLRRYWLRCRGHPPGYGPLPLQGSSPKSVASSAVSSPRSMASSSLLLFSPLTDRRKEQHITMVPSSLPRPRTTLLTSLCLWTVLMMASSFLGFNSIQANETMANSIFPASSSSLFSTSSPAPAPEGMPFRLSDFESQEVDVFFRQGGSIGQDGEEDQGVNVPAAAADKASMSPILILTDMEIMPAVLEAEEDYVWALEEVLKGEGQETAVRMKRDRIMSADLEKMQVAKVVKDGEVEEEEEEEVEEERDLDAMIMDAEDATVFHDFLSALEQEDGERMVVVPEKEEEERLHLWHLTKMLEATSQLMLESTLEVQQEMPCGYGGSRLGFLSRSSEDKGQVFDYLPGWTDMMILAVAMCLGWVLVGLAQAKALLRQKVDQLSAFSSFACPSTDMDTLHQEDIESAAQPSDQNDSNFLRDHSAWSILSTVICFLMSALALGMTLLVIVTESWDIPSIYFVGTGLAGMILTHAWVPNEPLLLVLSQSDLATDESSDSDSDSEEITCTPLNEKAAWLTIESVSERRNACSLDESRRWELASCCVAISVEEESP